MTTYRIVPFVPSGASAHSSPGQVLADQLQALIQDHASQGWEYLRLEECAIRQEPSCLGALLGHGPTMLSYHLAVFRAAAGSAPAAALPREPAPTPPLPPPGATGSHDS